MAPLPLPHRQYSLSTIVYSQHITSTVLKFRLKLQSFLDSIEILYTNSLLCPWRNLPVVRKLQPKRPPRILPFQKHTRWEDSLYSKYEYELVSSWFDQLVVLKRPYLWMDASPCCERFNIFKTLHSAGNKNCLLLPLDIFGVANVMSLSIFISVIENSNSSYIVHYFSCR